MGTILTRASKQGATRYTAVIRIKKAGKVVHTESETFGRKAHANEWMRRRESELDSSRARGEPFGKRYTLGELIKWYREEIGKTAAWGRSKEADLKRLENYEIAKRPAPSLTITDYLQHAYTRAEEGAGPATIGNDLIWIGQVLRSARPSLGVPANLEVLSDARHELRTRKMLAKSRHCDRRLKESEHQALDEHFSYRDVRAVIPMRDIYLFALATARREEEITRIKWVDIDKKKGYRLAR